MKDDLKLQLTDAMAPFLFKKKRFKGAFGGRGGTKSQTVADVGIHRVQTEGIKFGCFREHQNTIEDSVHSLLSEEIARMNVPGFKIGKTTIDHTGGGKFRFRGLARNTAGVKSFHGFNVFWVEEAQFLSKSSLKTLTPTLREADSEIWLTWNPLSRLDPVSQRFIVPFLPDLRRQGYYEDDDHYIVWVNYDQNPWFPEVLERERKLDLELLSQAEYNHTWLGHFNDTVPNALIKAEWFDACVDAHLKLKFRAEGKTIVSHDPSDNGHDDKGLSIRKGNVFTNVLRSKIPDVNDGMDWALEEAYRQKADWFNWDADGMGLSLKRQVKDFLEGEDIDWQMFRGSNGVHHPKMAYEEMHKIHAQVVDKTKQLPNIQAFRNRRAQCYTSLRDRCRNTYLALNHKAYRNLPTKYLVSFSSDIEDIEQLRAEISKIPLKPAPKGMIQILSKEEMAKLDPPVDSPNMADSCMMSEDHFEEKVEEEEIVFETPFGSY